MNYAPKSQIFTEKYIIQVSSKKTTQNIKAN